MARLTAWRLRVGAWTLALAALMFLNLGFAPCPELKSVGVPGRDDAAIRQMCEERHDATVGVMTANAPWSWLIVWGLGVGVIARRSRGGSIPD